MSLSDEARRLQAHRPLMPYSYIHWLVDLFFAAVFLGLIVLGVVQSRLVLIAGGCAMFVAIAAGACLTARRAVRDAPGGRSRQ